MSRTAIGLCANATKPAALAAASRLSESLAARNIPTVSVPDASPSEIRSCRFVVVFGGDGTLLGAARQVAPLGVPLLGIHLGRFGFITEAAPEQLDSAVERALTGDCIVMERMMVSARVLRAGEPVHDSEENSLQADDMVGVNDVVVTSRMVRMVYVRTQVGSETIATYAADGVIVATPTGSTGYSLSAGGPLVHPEVEALIVTPIAPHTLSARTLLVPPGEVVRLQIEGDTRDAALVTVDGQIERPLAPGDTVEVRRAACRLRLLGVGGAGFYAKIRQRWNLGERRPG